MVIKTVLKLVGVVLAGFLGVGVFAGCDTPSSRRSYDYSAPSTGGHHH
jgi:hypothetical protein